MMVGFFFGQITVFTNHGYNTGSMMAFEHRANAPEKSQPRGDTITPPSFNPPISRRQLGLVDARGFFASSELFSPPRRFAASIRSSRRVVGGRRSGDDSGWWLGDTIPKFVPYVITVPYNAGLSYAFLPFISFFILPFNHFPTSPSLSERSIPRFSPTRNGVRPRRPPWVFNTQFPHPVLLYTISSFGPT